MPISFFFILVVVVVVVVAAAAAAAAVVVIVYPSQSFQLQLFVFVVRLGITDED